MCTASKPFIKLEKDVRCDYYMTSNVCAGQASHTLAENCASWRQEYMTIYELESSVTRTN